MTIQQNIDLSGLSTMRLGGKARYMCTAHSLVDVEEAVLWAKQKRVNFIVVGTGSNIVWQDAGFDGLVICMKINDLQLGPNNTLTIGAGVSWDSAVEFAVSKNLHGIELLSLVPGTAGATPVQNVGAYGTDISRSLINLYAYDTQSEEFVTLTNKDCQFAYRTSIFKTTSKGRYIICSITLQLTADAPEPPFYETLQAYLEDHEVHNYTPRSLRSAIVAIRQSKLPDPTNVANCGSFFANPIITQKQYDEILHGYPLVKAWPLKNGTVKLAAGWLVEQAGFSDYHDTATGMATWAKQNLVLVNENAKSTQDLLDFKQMIVSAVQKQFGVTLQQEPELLPQDNA